jgi:hypothetical protein
MRSTVCHITTPHTLVESYPRLCTCCDWIAAILPTPNHLQCVAIKNVIAISVSVSDFIVTPLIIILHMFKQLRVSEAKEEYAHELNILTHNYTQLNQSTLPV